jgi:histidinol-phosphate/aromatic aminotransferase/cobyric acid decarboxylase-like protein
VHGGLHDAELRALSLRADQVLDFSSSTNPYGPHPAVVQALRVAAIERYPDATAFAAREALGQLLSLRAEQLVLGNGAAELLWTLARTLLGPGRQALIVEPTFCEFSAAARASGASVSEWRSRAEQGFAIDLGAISERARADGATVVYLCSPNTPTGTALAASELSEWASRHPELTLVLDQSFLSLSTRFGDAALHMPANVACVRSLTKDHGIPGVRVGYLIASPALCLAVEASRPAWTTSAFAQAATLACCECDGFVAESRARLLEDRRELDEALQALGIETLDSTTTFLLARVPGVTRLRSRLLSAHRILVRDCQSFGLPGFMRVAAKPAAERARLVQALRVEVPAC